MTHPLEKLKLNSFEHVTQNAPFFLYIFMLHFTSDLQLHTLSHILPKSLDLYYDNLHSVCAPQRRESVYAEPLVLHTKGAICEL